MQNFTNDGHLVTFPQGFLKNQYFKPTNYLPPFIQNQANKIPNTISLTKTNANNNMIANHNPFISLNTLLNRKNQDCILQNIKNYQICNEFVEKKKNEKKERNKAASKKWRAKQNVYLEKLDLENTKLRMQVFSMYKTMKQLKCENEFLNEELQFFQEFMSNKINFK